MRYLSLSILALMAFVHLQAQAETRSISVNGVAEKSMEPNMITFNLEVWSKSANAKQAQALNASEYKKVQKVLETYKIKKEDITTDSYSLNPEYVYDSKAQQNKMTGFRVVNNLAVTLRKVDDVGAFLDMVSSSAKSSEAGVNINNIQWDSDKRAQVELSGLGDAVINSRKKADEIAKAAGVKIKNVLHISHNVTNNNPPFPRVGFAKAMSDAESAPTQLSSGSIKVRIEVQAEYEL